MAVNELNAVSVALCELAEIDPNRVRSVEYRHDDPHEIPTLVFTVFAYDKDGRLLLRNGDLVEAVEVYEWRPRRVRWWRQVWSAVKSWP